jgi:8-oxo-dGTP pyrophosphatase MutT (NUDIX family)
MEVVFGTVIAVKSDDDLLLLKRAEEKGVGLWEFPKGTFESSDLTIHETARRELKEETGLEAIDMRYLGDIKRVDGGRMYVGYAYAIYSFRGEVKLSKEHDAYRWVKRRDIENYSLDTNTIMFLKMYKDF